MTPREEKRVKYFAKENMLCGHYLVLAEHILRNLNCDKEYDINDLIELYQIKLYIDNDLFLLSWDETDKASFKEKVKNIWSIIVKFWAKISDSNLIELFLSLEFGNQYAFWGLIEKLGTFKIFSESTFIEILDNSHLRIRDVLQNKKLVNHFRNALRVYLINNKNSAELILAQYEEKHLIEKPSFYFPSCLTIEDKEQIILNYLNWDDANLNYIRLIINSRNTDNLKLSDKTRLKAYNVERKKNNEILETGHVWNCSTHVALSQEQEVPVLITWEDNIQNVSYSTKWLDRLDDSFSIFQIFSNLFGFTDEFGLIELVGKKEEMDVMEKIFMKSKNSYSQGMVFTRKSILSHLQIFIFSDYLRMKNKTIEIILKDVIDGLNCSFGLKNLSVNFPSENTSNLEKVRMIAPEFESFLKQFQLFVEDGLIDHELLRISSTPKNISDIKSLVEKKYGYGTSSQKLQWIQHSFFSDQSMLWYVDPFKDKHHNLFSLLDKEDVSLTDFKNYQRQAIESFIEDGYLIENHDGFVKINKVLDLLVIGKLYKDEVISYWHFPPEMRTVIDQMEEEGLICFGDTLFSEPEQKYFNFYLNKSEFTDGLDLRNKYLHGTNSYSDEEHQNSYLIYLKLFVLALIKIVNDMAIDATIKYNY